MAQNTETLLRWLHRLDWILSFAALLAALVLLYFGMSSMALMLAAGAVAGAILASLNPARWVQLFIERRFFKKR